jgi:Ser/Thr protein kinase RdoA (MazF antagonist)
MRGARDALRFWARCIGPIAGLEAGHQNWAGEQGTVWAVITARGERFILKDIAGKLNAKRVRTEYDLLCHLQACGVPVAVPVLTDGGQLCRVDGERVYVLYPRLPGDHHVPGGDMRRVYANIGAAVARLHKALACYPGQIDSWTMDLRHRVFEEAVPRITRALTGDDGDRFADIMAALEGEMTAGLDDLPMQYIHGDCHGGNYLLYRGEVSGFVDLDHLPIGPRVYDIGYLLADMAKARFFDNHAHAGWLADFPCVLAGYQQESSLSGREKDAIWFVMLATQVLFVEWFLGHDRDDLARKNLAAFHWIYRHGDQIARRMSNI